MQILIPMAGAGRRFKDLGYELPKPLIDVNGAPMIQRVIENLGTQHEYIFIVQKQVWYDYSAELTKTVSICNSYKFICSDGLTQGAAETCLLAKKHLYMDKSLMIANCDQIMDWDTNHFYDWFDTTQSDGSILTFDSDSNKNSYVTLDKDGWVIEAKEKEVISNIATTGVYIWRKAIDFVSAAEQMIEKNIRHNNEFYVCPVYNENVSMGHKINTYHINSHWPIGTPEDLQGYMNAKFS